MLEQRIENYWDRRAESYSEHVQLEMACQKKQAWETLLRKYAGEAENLQVLDVGTGPGFFAILLAGLNYKVTAIDKCEEMLKKARENAASANAAVRFMKGDAHAVDLPAASMDLIVSRNVTWLLPNPQEAYQEWYRLLKPGGKALVFDANWQMYLTDPALKAEHDKYLNLAVEKGYKPRNLTPQQQKENEAIALKLPLTYERRPRWDELAFAQVGFRQIEIQENISPLVHDELEQLLYTNTPMFVVCAAK